MNEQRSAKQNKKILIIVAIIGLSLLCCVGLISGRYIYVQYFGRDCCALPPTPIPSY